MTDIHLTTRHNAVEGFRAAIRSVNEMKPRPDFVITGGDQIMDALDQSYGRADSLYDLYQKISAEFLMPVHNTIGNHEIFGLREKSGVSPDHPEFGKQMFGNRIGEGGTYRSFDFRGWHFVLLDGIGLTPDRQYIGMVDSLQLEWLKSDLAETGGEKPVVLVTHIPLATVATQFREGSLAPNQAYLVVGNTREIWEIASAYPLKLVLQGHLHLVEEIMWRNVRLITGGAVCAAWWTGPFEGWPEGYIVVDVKGDSFNWAFHPYGWDAASGN